MTDNPTISGKKNIYAIAPHRFFLVGILIFLMLFIPVGAWFAGALDALRFLLHVLTIGVFLSFAAYGPIWVHLLPNQKVEFRYPLSRKVLPLSAIRSVEREWSHITISHSDGSIRMPNDGWGTHKLAKRLQKENPQIKLKGFAQ